MSDRDPLVLVGLMKSNGRLVVLKIPASSLPIARTQGWMVFDDFEKLALVPDEDDGA